MRQPSSRFRKALRDRRCDFAAILALLAVAAFTGTVILIKQGLTLPSWVPALGSDRFELQIEFETAQAVTPGQGQSVNIAGIRVGDISDVRLEAGIAVVTVEIENEYAPLIHQDATAMLRPRTGLNDMTIELDPGTLGEPLAEGSTVPVANTIPQVQADQILASLDADTQAYLKLLLLSGADGLGGRGIEASALLRRLEPTARDIARINGLLAERRRHIRNAISDFRLLSEELARRDEELIAFVDGSNAVLSSFADQEAALRGALSRFPAALEATIGALESSGELARILGPALDALRPAARALGPALEAVRPFLTDTVAPIRDQIRPFTRDVQEPIAKLASAGQELSAATPDLNRALGDLNGLLNQLAYNPAGDEEGYLFWLSWLNHNLNSTFLTQDAGGPLRRGMVLLSCNTAELAEGVAASRPFLKTLQDLTRVPTTTEICPPSPFPFATEDEEG
jgi:phospholipid/cholesterol/gamma-HCH transport system substrate-binding protein